MELAGAERERVTDFLATRRGNSQDAMRGWGPPAGLGRTLRGAARRGWHAARCVPVRTRPRPLGAARHADQGRVRPARTPQAAAARSAGHATRDASAGNNSRLLVGPAAESLSVGAPKLTIRGVPPWPAPVLCWDPDWDARERLVR